MSPRLPLTVDDSRGTVNKCYLWFFKGSHLNLTHARLYSACARGMQALRFYAGCRKTVAMINVKENCRVAVFGVNVWN